MVEVNFNFNELRCIRQYDGGTASEPYMWIVFFYVDSSTVVNGQWVATRNMMPNVSARKLFQGDVRQGTVIPIPNNLGRARILLDDNQIPSPAVGAVYALLEENGTTDSLMQAGHRVFGQAFHEEINDYVRDNLPNVPPLSGEAREAMAQRIQDRVFAAVRDKATFYECFRSRDRVIGFTSEYFPWPAVALLRDRAPGQPYEIPQTIRLERTVYENSHPVQAIDEYEVRGTIQVSPYTLPTPDPCAALRAAYNRAAQVVEQLNDALDRLRTEFAQAPATQKAAIGAEIKEVKAQLAQAIEEAERTQEAYNRCRTQNPIRSRDFSF